MILTGQSQHFHGCDRDESEWVATSKRGPFALYAPVRSVRMSRVETRRDFDAGPASVGEGGQDPAGLGRARCGEAGVGREREAEVPMRGVALAERSLDGARVVAQDRIP